MLRLKIVHIIGSLTRGGAERLVVDLCNELSLSGGNEIIIVSLNANAEQATFVADINPRVRYVSFNKQAGFSLRVLLNLNRWLRRERPDVVHSHLNAFEYLYPYLLTGRRAGFLHTVHNVAHEECPSRAVKALRSVFYRIGRVKPVTISQNGRMSFRSYYGLTGDQLIENGCKSVAASNAGSLLREKYQSSSNTRLLLHVGRLAPEKNQEMLIRVVKRFNREERIKCRLLIIGEVHDKALAGRLTALAGNDEAIEFLGGRADVADFLSVADIFCLPSLYEGMPISLLEAMSAGCIPVCSPAGGMSEMIDHGFNGFLSSEITEEAYYQALRCAVYTRETAALKERIRSTFSSRYHITITARKHELLYKQLI
ncbi:glycosyltransferase family 4 protein [Pedobacter sp. SYP-B3415]|uniref:glycosyltransferase family 4 protein n=1 Tax=Pedobacter sp. SYP-B3415 TaxID=2496641 RepID=UPI00101DAF0C|nr:glycosyltransferase family 4 protein [Pedobacter sp. SYP-B3415]